MKKFKLVLLSIVTFLFLVGCESKDSATMQTTSSQTTIQQSSTEELTTVVENNNPTQERIDALLEQAMYYYWHGDDLKKNEEEFFKGLTLKGDQDVLESIFKQVIEIDPQNTDYQQALASTMLTNDKTEEALDLLDNILEQDPENYDVLMSHYVYDGLNNDSFDEETLEKLNDIDKERTDDFTDDFDLIEEVRENKIATDIKEYEDDHLFVLLGYALNENGEMEETLENRLEYALELLEKNPDSKIIVTGGVPQEGNTEAKVMNQWLIDHDIDEDRIIQEGNATDTIENALFSLRKASELDFSNNITIISSASHVRRAEALFTVANRIINESSTDGEKQEYEFDTIGEPDDEDLVNSSDEQERLVIYRDLLRLEGIWQYPNLQR
ncbi:MAG: YdcF family protein [Tetragenococcus koreensis]|uniref:YdcF family protein n=1 Tax=Tetragenococcus halophilus TaxID=51669 RepID=UPI001F25D355|nr:YdcF family protein [Tetragenococcus halophilus]MDN6140411.1 YdcF family protein [Tetragenococcus koreensis]MDN6630885.1 YdcF family protein [Staphylococcus equorum]MCF1675280.1 YdcF family protein [Tetragenococcus halophilus]MDN6146892.1 YdcF family protein [Tetragenococcus koreensis]MDN6166604.1 YdcF family protein [Tetragenococcus koreensis]